MSFSDLRAVDDAAGEVGEALHGPVRIGHAAVDAQNFQRVLRLRPVGPHGGDEIGGLETDAVERGLREFRGTGARVSPNKAPRTSGRQ